MFVGSCPWVCVYHHQYPCVQSGIDFLLQSSPGQLAVSWTLSFLIELATSDRSIKLIVYRVYIFLLIYNILCFLQATLFFVFGSVFSVVHTMTSNSRVITLLLSNRLNNTYSAKGGIFLFVVLFKAFCYVFLLIILLIFIIN